MLSMICIIDRVVRIAVAFGLLVVKSVKYTRELKNGT